jgi:ketosteroid isomerase-like protein
MASVGDDDEARARALWDAYARGDVDALRAQLDDDIEWRPLGGKLLRGPAEVAAYLHHAVETMSAVAHVFETDGDRVIVHGSLRRFRDGGFVDMQPTWVYRFRGGRLVRLESYESRDEARSRRGTDPT